MITSTTDEEALHRLSSRKVSKRPITNPSMGDPWKVSRSRDRSARSAVTARDEMTDNETLPPPSYAEIAYDKTSSIVQSVKGLLFSGISKIKTFIG